MKQLTIAEQLKLWPQFYKEFFNSELALPDILCKTLVKHEGLWLCIVPSSIIKKELRAWQDPGEFSDLDVKIAKGIAGADIDLEYGRDELALQDDYVMVFDSTIAADPDRKNLSADQLSSIRCDCITLLESFLLFHFHAWQGTELDNNTSTLCAGTRIFVGYRSNRKEYVPYIHTRDGKVHINACTTSFHMNSLRPRVLCFGPERILF